VKITHTAKSLHDIRSPCLQTFIVYKGDGDSLLISTKMTFSRLQQKSNESKGLHVLACKLRTDSARYSEN